MILHMDFFHQSYSYSLEILEIEARLVLTKQFAYETHSIRHFPFVNSICVPAIFHYNCQCKICNRKSAILQGPNSIIKQAQVCWLFDCCECWGGLLKGFLDSICSIKFRFRISHSFIILNGREVKPQNCWWICNLILERDSLVSFWEVFCIRSCWLGRKYYKSSEVALRVEMESLSVFCFSSEEFKNACTSEIF